MTVEYERSNASLGPHLDTQLKELNCAGLPPNTSMALKLEASSHMNPQSSSYKHGHILSLMLRVPLAVAIFTTGSVLSNVQSGKRELDDRVPSHLPIKIGIKKEKASAFSDLKNEHWQQDFELEVKNIGNKPIYCLSLVVLFTDVTMPDGKPYGVGLRYGRIEFESQPGTIPVAEDKPINPGETFTFKIPDLKIQGWEAWSQQEHLAQPKQIQILFDFLSFGDDTGFESPGGKELERKKPSAVN